MRIRAGSVAPEGPNGRREPRAVLGLPIEDIGFDHDLVRFVVLEEAPITALFKLYPWEFILDDDFGRRAVESVATRAASDPAVNASPERG